MAESYPAYHMQHAFRFAQTIFHNVWMKQAILPKEMLILKSNFENVENAVWVSQLLLRDYFRTFLTFIFIERDFKNDAKIIWINWLQNRSNDCVKLVDTLAIISEIFLYRSNYDTKFHLNSMNAALWFCEWFQYYFPLTNFINVLPGLDIQASELYGELFLFIHVKCGYTYQNIISYDDSIYDEDSVWQLTSSRVMFPVPERFGNSITRHLFKNIVCIRYKDESEVLDANKISNMEMYYQEKKKNSSNSAFSSNSNNIQHHPKLDVSVFNYVDINTDKVDAFKLHSEFVKKSNIHPSSTLFMISKRHQNCLEYFYQYIDLFCVNNIKFIKFPEQTTSDSLGERKVPFPSDSETFEENTLSPFPFEGTLKILICEFACYFVGHQC